jgi:hypothetical protein
MDRIRLEDTPRSDAFRQLQDTEELEQIRYALAFNGNISRIVSHGGLLVDMKILLPLVTNKYNT